MVSSSICETHRYTDITSFIISPTLHLKAKILKEVCMFTFTIYIHFITLHITKILSLSYLLILFWIKYYRKNIAHFILIAWKISSGNRLKPTSWWKTRVLMTDHRQSQEIIQQPNTSSWKNTGSKTDKEQYLILRQQCCFAEGISRCLTASNPARARTYRGWVYRTKCRVPVYFMASGPVYCVSLAFVCSPW